MEPVGDLVRAITFPFTALFVVGVCFAVNAMTSPHHWWVQWVVFGMGIALVRVWMRAARVLFAGVGVAAVAYVLHRWWTRRTAATPTRRTSPHDDVVDVA